MLCIVFTVNAKLTTCMYVLCWSLTIFAAPYVMEGKDGSDAYMPVPYLSAPGEKPAEVTALDANDNVLDVTSLEITILEL